MHSRKPAHARRVISAYQLLTLQLVALAGCSRDVANESLPSFQRPAGQPTVTLFAASSTASVLDEIKAAFLARTGVRVQASYAASSTLAQQICQGAEADLFLSANVEWADDLARQVAVASRCDLLENRLVIVVAADSELPFAAPADLLNEQIHYVALADPDAVPAGQYARLALTKLGLWESVRRRVAVAKDARHALAYVETGAAEAGLVYATDAAVSDAVRVVWEIPAELTGPVRYPLLLLERAASNEAARAFYDELCSSAATPVFERFGFVVLAGAAAHPPSVNKRDSSFEPQP